MNTQLKFGAFTTEVPGKWVLSGEHAVLRGGLAVAMPHPHFRLGLRFHPQECGSLMTSPSEAKEFAGSLIDQMYLLTQCADPSRPQGLLEIQSTIPYGAGLGSSAALCVALVRWLQPQLSFSKDRIREIATRLEDRFHGKSSGMDVAVTSLGSAIRYQIREGVGSAERIRAENLPRFTFHDTGLRKKTSESIGKVDRFRFEHPGLGEKLDRAMNLASHAAAEALEQFNVYSEERDPERKKALNQLSDAMKQGQECFKGWDLVPDSAEEIEQKLYLEGARAVKLTGAGGGGYLVALWES